MSSLLDALAGVALAVAGLGSWQRRRPAPAVLLLATAAFWFAGGLWPPLVLAHRGPLTHLLIGYPRGRLTRPVQRVVVAAGYVSALVYPVGRSGVVTLLVGGAVVAVVAAGLRRSRFIAFAAATTIWGVLGAGAVARLTHRHIDTQVLLVYTVTMTVVAVALLADTRLRRGSRAAITSLAVDLGQAAPRSVRELLARALDDPALVLGYADPATGGLTDESGQPVAIGTETPGRTTTELREGDRRIAVLIHDSAVLDDPVLIASATALTRIALANARLQAEVTDRLAQVDASRRRLLTVADAERAGLEAELRAGVQARLDRAATLLEPVTDGGVSGLLTTGRQAIDEFAHGMYPRALTEHGLAVAVRELASRAPVPVTVTVPDDRFDPDVEAAAYFVCAEGLTNLAKYAGATTASVRVSAGAGELRVEVGDDGVGGADPVAGSGLTGLADRLAVLGGRLVVDSPAGRGTRLSAGIPWPGRLTR